MKHCYDGCFKFFFAVVVFLIFNNIGDFLCGGYYKNLELIQRFFESVFLWHCFIKEREEDKGQFLSLPLLTLVCVRAPHYYCGRFGSSLDLCSYYPTEKDRNALLMLLVWLQLTLQGPCYCLVVVVEILTLPIGLLWNQLIKHIKIL